MANTEHKYTNALINESSPYLLQHAHNPVNWYPWGDEALQKAKEENKLLIISIGYAACHWCHVMEHESFEDTVVASLMNDNFVAIKIDREERPDIDQIYMNAAYITNGSGGWPLNAISLPDGRPVYAGTYYPKKNWMELLNYMVDGYQNRREEFENRAVQYEQGIKRYDQIAINPNSPQFDIQHLDEAFEVMQSNFDYNKGGRQGAPKFPMPSIYEFLLSFDQIKQNNLAQDAVTSTLDNIALGGIYDHLGGGFARYSVDANWLVPHFEKMLYDNGQLVSLYSHAYQKSNKPLYKKAVLETLEWVEREMTSAEGSFYSSLDADSDGEEGKFYVWQKADIDSFLTEDSKIFNDYYNVTERGNWEHKNILVRYETDQEVADKWNISTKDLEQLLSRSKSKLMIERDKRIRPGLDDKQLTSWNALMLKGYVDAYNTFGIDDYLTTAIRNAEFLSKNAMKSDGRLNRNYKDGKSVINAFLDDYSLTIEAFVSLYQATFDEQWLNKANTLLEYVNAHFYDETTGMYFYTSDLDPALITRKMEVSDNVIPGSNSSIAKSLFLLGTYLYNQQYIDRAELMLNNTRDQILTQASYYSNWALLETWFINKPFEIAIVGDDWQNLRKEFNQHFLPNALFLGGKDEGSLELLTNKAVEDETMIYVCKNKTCKLPVTTVEEAMRQMN